MIKNQLDKYGRADLDDRQTRAGLPIDFVNERYTKADGMTLFGVALRDMDAAELLATASYLAERLSVWEGHHSPSLRSRLKKPATSFVITVTGGDQ